MKNKLVISFLLLGMGVLGSENASADPADTCAQCTSLNSPTVSDCTNNWLLSGAECENIICPQCPAPSTSKLLK